MRILQWSDPAGALHCCTQPPVKILLGLPETCIAEGSKFKVVSPNIADNDLAFKCTCCQDSKLKKGDPFCSNLWGGGTLVTPALRRRRGLWPICITSYRW